MQIFPLFIVYPKQLKYIFISNHYTLLMYSSSLSRRLESGMTPSRPPKDSTIFLCFLFVIMSMPSYGLWPYVVSIASNRRFLFLMSFVSNFAACSCSTRLPNMWDNLIFLLAFLSLSHCKTWSWVSQQIFGTYLTRKARNCCKFSMNSIMYHLPSQSIYTECSVMTVKSNLWLEQTKSHLNWFLKVFLNTY